MPDLAQKDTVVGAAARPDGNWGAAAGEPTD